MKLSTDCDLLVLTCIDFRFPNKIRDYLDQRGFANDYDLHTLPGASLGACCDQFPHWQTTFKDIIGLAKQLHNIKKIMIIDHQDCGAFHNLVARPENDEHEFTLHQSQASTTKAWLQSQFPDLEHELVYMDLDGNVKPL